MHWFLRYKRVRFWTVTMHYATSVSWPQGWLVTSSSGSFFRVTGPLCGEFTGRRIGPYKVLNKQPNDRRFETTRGSCGVIVIDMPHWTFDLIFLPGGLPIIKWPDHVHSRMDRCLYHRTLTKPIMTSLRLGADSITHPKADVNATMLFMFPSSYKPTRNLLIVTIFNDMIKITCIYSSRFDEVLQLSLIFWFVWNKRFVLWK